MKTSNKLIAITSLVITSSLASPTHAMSTEAKQGSTFFTSTVLGAVAGGPVGFVLGALGGAYMGEHIKKSDSLGETQETLKETRLALDQSQNERSALRRQLAATQLQTEQLQELAISNMKFQVLFRTGQDELTERGKDKVQTLAKFLEQNPALLVRLNGHADPRGTDKYNNVLSDFRALNVENDLMEAGIDPTRIERVAHGALASTASKGDLEAYAMERRVNIEIFNPVKQASVAMH